MLDGTILLLCFTINCAISVALGVPAESGFGALRLGLIAEASAGFWAFKPCASDAMV